MPQVNNLDEVINELVYGQLSDGTSFKTKLFPTRNELNNTKKHSDLERMQIVCNKTKIWILDFAKKLADEPNTGYAVLSMLNFYFDMIADFHGFTPKRPIKERMIDRVAAYLGYVPKYKRVEGRTEFGLSLVLPELARHPQIAQEIVRYLRNPMAHTGTTQDYVILSNDYYRDDPLVWGTFRKRPRTGVHAIVINPRMWTLTICRHFDGFMSTLLDADPKDPILRSSFLEHIKRPS